MKRAIYGKKSEKIDQNQLELALEELEAALAETQAAQAQAQNGASNDKPRKPPKRNLGRLPIELPRIENIIEPESTLCPCACCKQMVKIGEDRSKRLDITPVPILDPGRGKTKKGYFWVLARDDRGWSGASNSEAVGQTKSPDPPAVIFNYAPRRDRQQRC